MAGYDLALVRMVAEAVDVPVIACGGAGNLSHLQEAVHEGASAVAAGSLFTFYGKHRVYNISAERARSALPATALTSSRAHRDSRAAPRDGSFSSRIHGRRQAP